MQVLPTAAEDHTSKCPGLSAWSFLLPEPAAAPTTRADCRATSWHDPPGQATHHGSFTVGDRGKEPRPQFVARDRAGSPMRPPTRPATPPEGVAAPAQRSGPRPTMQLTGARPSGDRPDRRPSGQLVGPPWITRSSS
ncbi:hypothetical protein NDU88_004965 [Pleurodeles waltl]|uniref:Uncharacterized protein n=1 Tax=Pleurodeles waltl TaxID=8319 RepID=A0AAV7UHG9_PLEWA|nr:hypothetical protein NDU88_004965 [Pleurodeles waltl]